MVTPRSFYGYDQKGNCIASCNAYDVTSVLDPNEIKAAIENLINVFQEEMVNLANALRETTADSNEAIVVEGTKMTGLIEDTADSILQIPSQVIDSFTELYNIAVQRHDTLQNEVNEEAYNLVRGHSGVVRITG